MVQVLLPATPQVLLLHASLLVWIVPVMPEPRVRRCRRTLATQMLMFDMLQQRCLCWACRRGGGFRNESGELG